MRPNHLACAPLLFLMMMIPDSAKAAPVNNSGEAGYREHCASCHGVSLSGRFGPALSGEIFQKKWSAYSPQSLLEYTSNTMPPAKAGQLTPSSYLAISNFVARFNGLAPASQQQSGQATQTSQPVDNASPNGADIPESLRDLSSVDPRDDDIYYQAALARRKALLTNFSPVTDAQLRNPSPGNWSMWRRTFDTRGYSPLEQISRANVESLTLDWSLSLSPGTNGVGPIVHDGVMFLKASGTVMALDASNGDLLWKYVGKNLSSERSPLSQTRGVALYNDRVYVPTMDGHVLALDVRTGKLIWDQMVFGPEGGLQLTAVPLVAGGKIIQGIAGCSGPDYGGGCYLVAMDAKTGKEAWRFHTIARPGQPGGDSWNGAPLEDRYGGSIWITGSYDAELNLVYFGTGQTYDVATLLQPNERIGKSSDALYTDSTLAINPDTGELVWHYQHLAGDVWDLDWAFERTLITLDGPDGPRKAMVTGGKSGIFDVLDAKTGQYLFSKDMGIQTLIKSIDPRTGNKIINPKARYTMEKGGFVCPYIVGGRNWLSTAYDTSTDLLFIPMVESCMEVFHRISYAERLASWRLMVPPNSDGKFGRVAAFNLRTKEIQWTNRRRAQPASAMLATAGGVVFEGSRDRTFRALNSETGKTLWETNLSDTPNSFPITYLVDGVQYVAVVLGGNTPQDISYRSYTPEIPNSNGARSIWVFALKD